MNVDIQEEMPLVAPMEVALEKGQNPFVGLRPFEEHEKGLYFGREEQVEDVIEKMLHYRFVSILGVSGIGKSSFLYCGIEPNLVLKPTNFSTEWNILKTRPNDQPKQSLLKTFESFISNQSIDSEEKKELLSFCKTELFFGEEAGLTNIILKFSNRFETNFCLIVDQFEELFRIVDYYDNSQNSEESSSFVAMLVHALDKENLPLYVAIGMRSDFIGECARYPFLAKHINNSQFLVPQLISEQLKKVIKGPLDIAGTGITDELLDRIIDDVQNQIDQLPIMQHALMRTWQYWHDHDAHSNPLSEEHYEAVGTMKHALSKHAQEAFTELHHDQRNICRRLFKCITEKKEDGRGIRKPATVHEIAQIANCSPDAVMEVVEVFRKPGRTLLMPPPNVSITDKSVIDISHESIMRIWELLKNWVEDESESVKLYLRLCDAAQMHQSGKSGLWRPPDLDIALAWRKQQEPSLTWAKRYDVAFERAMIFLEYSEKEFLKEQRRKEKLQKRRLFVAKITASILGFGIIIAVLFLFYGEQKRREANKQKQIAEAQKVEADEQRVIAKQENEKAKVNAKEALKQTKIAKEAANKAEQSLTFAIKQQGIAEKKEQEAQEQKKLAEASRLEAEKASNQAYKLRLLSIGKSLAIKSQQVEDSSLQALMARQSYNYYQENEGNKLDPDLYNALYYAIKSNEKEDYNLLKYHSQNVRSIVTSTKKQKTYSAGSDGKIIEWSGNMNEKNINILFNNHSLIHKSLFISPDNSKLIAAGDYPFILLFDLENKSYSYTQIKLEAEEVWRAGFTGLGNRIIAIGAGGNIFEYDINSESNKFSLLKNIEGKINTLAMHPADDSFLLGKSDGNILHFDSENNQSLYSTQNEGVISLALDSSGKRLAIGHEGGQVELWDFINKNEIKTLRGHSARVNNLVFSKDGTKLTSASFDKTVRIWNIKDLDDQSTVLSDHYDWVWSIAYSSDGKHILAGCRDKIIRLWPVSVDQMGKKLCEVMNRKRFRTEEWTHYVANDIPIENTCK